MPLGLASAVKARVLFLVFYKKFLAQMRIPGSETLIACVLMVLSVPTIDRALSGFMMRI